MTSAPEWLVLDPGETVVRTGHPRVRRVLSTVVTALVWSVVAVAAGVVVTGYADLDVPSPLVWGVVALWVLLQAAGIVWRYLVTVNVEYVLTTENVYARSGVLSETVTRVGLDRVQNVKLGKHLFGKVFDYGTIAISTAGSEGWELTVEDLDAPDEFRNDLRRLTARASGGPGRSERERPGPGIDPRTLDGMVKEARKLRASAERVRREFT